jgi:DNA-binding NtrC family response regulator
MESNTFKAVVIHDGLIPKIDPLLVELNNEFGEASVIHFENSNQGLEYVLSNLNQKMIVLLDINFSHGELSGIQVFEDIKQRTALIYVIMVTARSLGEIDHNDLVTMINHDAFAIENVHNYPKIIELVKTAIHKMEVRVDSALEQWINLHSEEDKDKPYIVTRDGKTYTLREILEEIRLQTPYGRDVEKKILMLAIDMLARGKKQING